MQAAPSPRERNSTVKQIFITTDQMSDCASLAEILEAVFPECEIRIVVEDEMKTAHDKTTRVFPSSVPAH